MGPTELAGWVADYLADLEAGNYRPTTVDTYRKALAAVVDQLGQVGDAAALLRVLAQKAPATRALYLTAARAFDAWCAESGRTPRPVLAGRVRVKLDEPEPRPFARAELRALDAAAAKLRGADECSRRMQLLYLLLRATGVRIGEALALRWPDVVLEGGREALRLRDTKGRADRVLPLLAGPLVARLKSARRRAVAAADGADLGEAFVFAVGGDPGRAWSYRAALAAFDQLAVVAGVAEATPHRLRHTRATELADGGASPFTLRQAMGWKKLDTAARYVQAPELRAQLTRLSTRR